ncbi:MAG TPA: ABC transporter permease [Polyangiaceae bacterium]|nr:ABC transporter permease [Polyangiaceae bacterium]
MKRSLGFSGRIGSFLLPLAGPVAALVAWWQASYLSGADGFAARFAPRSTFAALGALLVSGELWPHVVTSLRRIVLGLSLATGVGFPLGVLVGALPRFGRASAPVFHFLRMVSPLAWTPVAIMVLGIGDTPVVFLLSMASVWPVVLATSSAVAALDDHLPSVGRSLGATRLEVARTIVWPSIRPQVTTGLRVAIGLSWVVLVPAEMLGVDSGLGYFILSTRDRLAYSELAAAILVVGALGLALDAAARHFLSDRPGRRHAGQSRTTSPKHHGRTPPARLESSTVQPTSHCS